MALTDWLLPSVIVGAAGLLVQGIKSGWDLIMAIRTSRNTRAALRLQELNAIIHLIEGLPLPPSQKDLWKVRLVDSIRKNTPLTEIYKSLDKLVDEVCGRAA
jgi:hypothetical protein